MTGPTTAERHTETATTAIHRIEALQHEVRVTLAVRDDAVWALHSEGAMTPGQIARATGMSKSNVKRILELRKARRA